MNDPRDPLDDDYPNSQRDQLVICAGNAAASVLATRGLDAVDIANGLLAFAGAMMIELVGAGATAEVFASKAEALRGKTQ